MHQDARLFAVAHSHGDLVVGQHLDHEHHVEGGVVDHVADLVGVADRVGAAARQINLGRPAHRLVPGDLLLDFLLG